MPPPRGRCQIHSCWRTAAGACPHDTPALVCSQFEAPRAGPQSNAARAHAPRPSPRQRATPAGRAPAPVGSRRWARACIVHGRAQTPLHFGTIKPAAAAASLNTEGQDQPATHHLPPPSQRTVTRDCRVVFKFGIADGVQSLARRALHTHAPYNKQFGEMRALAARPLSKPARVTKSQNPGSPPVATCWVATGRVP